MYSEYTDKNVILHAGKMIRPLGDLSSLSKEEQEQRLWDHIFDLNLELSEFEYYHKDWWKEQDAFGTCGFASTEEESEALDELDGRLTKAQEQELEDALWSDELTVEETE